MWPHYEPSRQHKDGDRFYKTPAGLLHSVTTVLGNTRDQRGLQQWREWVGESEADLILKVACARGDGHHLNIEGVLLRNEEPKLSLLTRPYWKSFKPFLDEIKKPLLVEGAVWHKDGYAGTLDCIAQLHETGDAPILLDWKTADKPKPPEGLYEYSLQCAAYVHAANYVYKNIGVEIKAAKIVIAVADDQLQIEHLDEDDLSQLYSHFHARLTRFIKR